MGVEPMSESQQHASATYLVLNYTVSRSKNKATANSQDGDTHSLRP